jgi:hypothetical protein
MSRRTPLLALLVSGLTAAGQAAPPVPAASPAASGEARRQIDALRRALEGAVSRAAGPGRVGARAAGGGVYHLPGYGAMLVLTPRALPVRSVIVLRPDRNASPSNDVSLLGEAGELPDMDTVMTIDLGELERELQRQMAAQARAMRELERSQRERRRAAARDTREQEVRREIEAIEAQVEQMREEADRVRAMAERQVLVHLGLVEPPATPAPAAVPAAPEAPQPPVAPPPRVIPPPAPGVVELAPPVMPREAPSPDAPPPPPWRFWFEGRGEREAPRPEIVVAAVRDALVSGLESHRGSLSALKAEEWVTVAVDFVPQLAGRPARTLQARVRVKDLQERRAGKVAGDAFRQRVQFEEY